MGELKKSLSASRIKVLQSCSWLYYCKYVLRLPEETNQGALMGSVCHEVFERIGAKRHKNKFDFILKNQQLDNVTQRYVKTLMNKTGVLLDNYDLVEQMIYHGLNHDFFGKARHKPSKIISEFPFDLEVISGDIKYKINGYIDKLFIYKNNDRILIRDFKTSKEVYSGKDVDDNMQDLIYRLAVSKIFPEIGQVDVEFVFVKPHLVADGNHIVLTPNVDTLELEGLEYLLTEYQDRVEFFTYADGLLDLAASKGFPDKNEGFCKRALCGRANTLGQLKKDGTPMWHCPHKFAYKYFSIIDSNGESIRSDKDKIKLKKYKKKGQKIVEKEYLGCPAFNQSKYYPSDTTDNDFF